MLDFHRQPFCQGDACTRGLGTPLIFSAGGFAPLGQPLRASRRPPGRARVVALNKFEHRWLLALDVEHVHVEVNGKRKKFAAEACLVDSELREVYHTYIRHKVLYQRTRWRGGVPWVLLESAPAADVVASEIQATLEGRFLVGFGLLNDLTDLGVQTDPKQQLDLLQLAFFRGSTFKSLKSISKQLLGLDIQRGKRRHSARQDACAVMQLYTKFAHLSPDSDPGILEAYCATADTRELYDTDIYGLPKRW